MIRPDLVIFDCDGVLVDSEMLSCRCLVEVLATHGISLGLDQALDLFLGTKHISGLRALPKRWATRFPSSSPPTSGRPCAPRLSPRFARSKAWARY